MPEKVSESGQTTDTTAHADTQSELPMVSREDGLLLYRTGFLKGTFSDIDVSLFSHTLPLHRIILLSNRYFNAMLTGAWAESKKSEIVLTFDDPNISLAACKYVFAKLYGFKETEHCMNAKKIEELTSILAAASYFLDSDLIAAAKAALLHKISGGNVSDIAKLTHFANTNDYIDGGSEDIMEGVFSLLCREYYSYETSKKRMLSASVDHQFLGQVISSDCFYCPDEFSRYLLLAEILQDGDGTGDGSLTLYAEEASQSVSSAQRLPSFLREPLPPISPRQKDPATTSESLDTSIMDGLSLYHIPLHQLQRIESEGLVPLGKIHEAFWQRSVAQSRIDQLASPVRLPRRSTMQSDEIEGSNDHQQTEEYHRIPKDDTAKIDAKRLRNEFDWSRRNGMCNVFRFGCEFSDLEAVESGLRVYSSGIEYLGSEWVVYLQKVFGENEEPKLGCYLQRNAGTGSWVDKRSLVRAWFKIYVFISGTSSCYVLESKPDAFNLLQSWGWRSAKMAKEVADASSTDCVLRCCVVMGQI